MAKRLGLLEETFGIEQTMFGVAIAGFEPSLVHTPESPPSNHAAWFVGDLARQPGLDLRYFSSRILGFPVWLHNAFARAPPMNYIFHAPETSSRKRWGFALLSKILGTYSPRLRLASGRSPLKEAHIVFIHFGDLGSRTGLSSLELQRKGTLFVGFGRSVLHTNPTALPSFALLFHSGK